MQILPKLPNRGIRHVTTSNIIYSRKANSVKYNIKIMFINIRFILIFMDIIFTLGNYKS